MDFLSLSQQLMQGMLVTVELFVLTLVFSLILGLGVAFCRMSKNIMVRSIAKVYISIMRGTPLMLQLLVVYFGPYFIFGMSISQSYRFIAAVIAFVVNYAAYFAEIYRGGIETMEVGQYEAAQVLGFSKSQAFLKIIFPQVIKKIIPAVTNEVITLVKDTSLAYTIGVIEMFTIAEQTAASQCSMMPYLAAGIFYYIFNFIVAFGMEKIEKKFNYYTNK